MGRVDIENLTVDVVLTFSIGQRMDKNTVVKAIITENESQTLKLFLVIGIL